MANDEYREQHERDRQFGLKARQETRQERAIRRQVRDEVLRGYHSMLCNNEVPDWTFSGELEQVTDTIMRLVQPLREIGSREATE